MNTPYTYFKVSNKTWHYYIVKLSWKVHNAFQKSINNKRIYTKEKYLHQN